MENRHMIPFFSSNLWDWFTNQFSYLYTASEITFLLDPLFHWS